MKGSVGKSDKGKLSLGKGKKMCKGWAKNSLLLPFDGFLLSGPGGRARKLTTSLAKKFSFSMIAFIATSA